MLQIRRNGQAGGVFSGTDGMSRLGKKRFELPADQSGKQGQVTAGKMVRNRPKKQAEWANARRLVRDEDWTPRRPALSTEA